jgi:GDP-4-dehydro-6-deoxy-D-mannose reductase
LARELRHAGWQVDGLTLPATAEAGLSIDGTRGGQLSGSSFSRLFFGDVCDDRFVRSALAESRPDAVFHLAGVSLVSDAERHPALAFNVNVGGALNLLGALRVLRDGSEVDPVCLLVGSAEQYGRHDESELPLGEEAELRPLTTYAASKCAQEVVGLQMHRAHGIRVICVRSFNHSGAGQRPEFLIPSLVRRALEVKAQGRSTLPIGNVTPVRDYLHVDDVVRAYRLLVERGAEGETYNVSSGTGRSVEEIALLVLDKVGVGAALEVDSKLVRRADVPVLIGSNSRLVNSTGWRPAKQFGNIIEDLILAAA